MQTSSEISINVAKREPWNKGKLIGPKPPVNGALMMYRRGGAKMYHAQFGGLST